MRVEENQDPVWTFLHTFHSFLLSNFHAFTLFTLNSFTLSLFTLSHDYRRVEEGQEPVNLTGGPLAYKYQFQEMFFHWGEKVVIMMVMLMLMLMLMLIIMFFFAGDIIVTSSSQKSSYSSMLITVFTEEKILRVVMVQNTQLLIMLSLQSCRFLSSFLFWDIWFCNSVYSNIYDEIKCGY